MKRIGVDVGGTHTDLVLVDEARGRTFVHKVATTPGDPSAGAIRGLAELCALAGVAPHEVDWFMHGTTIATNVILEHNGARVGLITTEGFRDLLRIARHKRPHNFSLQLDLPWQKHELVRRRDRLPVRERVGAPDGRVLAPLDEEAVRAAARTLRERGVESIAICFLFSFLNPAHERRAAEIVAEEVPGVHVSTSHEVIPLYREYERFSTTCLNAYVGPKTSRYLGRLDEALRGIGLRAGLHLMQSSGGAATLDAAGRRPVSLLMSGPAGGLLGGVWVGATAGHPSVISLDVGGTSADIGVAPDGQVRFKHLLDTRIGDYHAMVPMVECDTIGAGGGSIAYVDSGGQFQVGPRSAGADPGPCCYDKGGTEPAATDCQVVLGRIGAAGLLGGRMKLREDLARRAIEEQLARPLGMSVEKAALSALRILTHSMVLAIELNSVRKGYDPRDFALVAFGGAGPLFACDIARELSIPKVIVPPLPGLTSALGLLTSDVSYDYSTTRIQPLAGADPARIAAAIAELETQAHAQLERDGLPADRIALRRFADCRYVGQGYELRTAGADGPVDAGFLAGLARGFHDAHQREYGRHFPDKDVELVNLRVVGIGRVPPLAPAALAAGGPEPPAAAFAEPRTVVFESAGEPLAVRAIVVRRDALLAGNRLRGPAIVEQMDSTTVIPPGFAAEVDRAGNLIIRFEE
jgi:N-methylhydantoinase A/oxoprolinase/acetone carboxylase beta subunit